MSKTYKPIVLLILDGWGLAEKSKGNAIELAKKPNYDLLWKKYSHTQLRASGVDVGLPDGRPGNSEAGHMNIGAGRVVLQDAAVIDRAIADKSFYENKFLLQVADHVKTNKSRLHVMGMISDGDSPHSSMNHLEAIIDFANKHKFEKVFLHLFTDGRDSPQRSAYRILKIILDKLHALNGKYDNYELVTIMGRFYAMDRNKNWGRTARAYESLVNGRNHEFEHYKEAVEHAYNSGLTDEFIEPSIIHRKRKGFENSRIEDDDAIIFFNLRSDRARQLTKAFAQNNFNKKNPGSFKRSKVLKKQLFCALTDFGPGLSKNLVTAFPSEELISTIPFVMNPYKQLYIAESEKFAHITYFFNGGHPRTVAGEERVKIQSQKVDNYKEVPKMAADEITDYVLEEIKKKKKDFIVINLSNPDMIGHTGDLKASVKSIEFVDKCIGKLSSTVLNNQGIMFVTADHGNAEKMLDEKGEIYAEHTSNLVPFILVSDKFKNLKLADGNLGDIAPTIYELFKIDKPECVTGESLVKNSFK